jgi:hypothetical protein
MKILIIIGGFLWLAFFVFHAFFWYLFDWKNDLEKLSTTNKAVMQVLNLCLMLCFLIFAYISIFQTDELLNTSLGKTLLFGMVLFGLFRAIEQIIFFDLKHIRSKIVLIIAMFGATIYAIPFYFSLK